LPARPATRPPAGPGWIHEIKHGGFCILAAREGNAVMLHSREGYDFAGRFPPAATAVAALPVRSCLIDGEAIVCDANGLGSVRLAPAALERRRRDPLCPRVPIEERKRAPANLLRRQRDGIAFNEH
jgi:ATP-dependent DNA ligase